MAGGIKRRILGGLGRLFQIVLALVIAALLTVASFLVLPLMEQVGQKPAGDLQLQAVSTAELPPPPPPPPDEAPPPAKNDEPPPPELSEQAPPLDLSQLELALNPGMGGDGMAGDFAVKLIGAEGQAQEQAEEVFSLSDLDQAPRAVFQPAPTYPPELKRNNVEGTVQILFIVDQTGRVQNPVIQKSAHPAFEQPALQALRRWRFEPAKRQGKPVQFKMRVPITFMNR